MLIWGIRILIYIIAELVPLLITVCNNHVTEIENDISTNAEPITLCSDDNPYQQGTVSKVQWAYIYTDPHFYPWIPTTGLIYLGRIIFFVCGRVPELLTICYYAM